MFKTISETFYSPRAYYNAVLYWRWKTPVYFLLLCLITALINSLAAVPSFKKNLRAEIPAIVKQLPEISFRNCEVVLPDGKDKIVVNSSSGRPLFAVGNAYLKPADVNNLLFSFEKDRFYAFPANAQDSAQCIKLEEFRHLVEKDKTYTFKTGEIFGKILEASSVLIPVFVFFGGIMLNAMFVVIMTPACYILSLSLSPNMGFARSVKFAVLAITPVSILSSLLAFFPVPNIGIFYAVATLILSWYIMRNMPQLPPRYATK